MTFLDADSDPPLTLDASPDERRHRRERLYGVSLKNPVQARLLDISQGGLGIESQRPLSLGEQYPFSFSIGAQHAKVRGEVRWSKLVGTSPTDTGDCVPVYRLGVALLDLTQTG